MKKILRKVRDKIKEEFQDGKEIFSILFSFPVVGVTVIILFAIGILAELYGINPVLGTIEVIAMSIIVALLAVILICIEKPREYIVKIFIFSLLWFASCLVLVDFKNFSVELFLRIVTAFEFIFLGCLLPDFVNEMNKIKVKKGINKSEAEKNDNNDNVSSSNIIP